MGKKVNKEPLIKTVKASKHAQRSFQAKRVKDWLNRQKLNTQIANQKDYTF